MNEAEKEIDYLIWSVEHNAWWRPNRRGYTNHIARAGRYTRAGAIEICKVANFGFASRHEQPNEIMMPEQDAIDCLGERPEEKGTW